jgi:sec-independent protein translocase protein TatA
VLGFFESIGLPELLIILAVLVMVFGAKRLPDIARSLGRSSKEFKKGMKDGAEDGERDASAPPATAAPAKAE